MAILTNTSFARIRSYVEYIERAKERERENYISWCNYNL